MFASGIWQTARMNFHQFTRALGFWVATLLLYSSAMAQSVSVEDELRRIFAVSKIIRSDYVEPVAEALIANACREGILQLAGTQASDAIAQATKLDLDKHSLQDVLRLIPFFIEKSPHPNSARQLGDACLHSMLQALDARSAYFDQTAFEQFRKPPPPAENRASQNGASAASNDASAQGNHMLSQTFVSKTLDGRYLYLRIGSFNVNVVARLGATLRTIEPIAFDGMAGVVLDLRGNLGGDLKSSVGVASAFLPKSAPVLTTVDRNRQPVNYLAEPKFYSYSFSSDELRALPAATKTLPLVVLVNQHTAAGAEAVAAALQDNQRAIIFGEPTLGYGTVQTFRPLGSDTGIKYTTSKFVRPNGDEWDRKGVIPNRLTVHKVRENVEMGSKDDTELAEALRMFDKH